MWFIKKEKFTFLDWAIHFGIGINILVIISILFYVLTH